MLKRFLKPRLLKALSDTPVVLVVGPRRAGKTTLVREIEEQNRTYITLDDPTVLDGAEPVPFGDRLAAVPLSCLWN